MFLSEKNTPRWIIFFIDIFICLFSLLLAYLLRFNFSIPKSEIATFSTVIPFVVTIRIISFFTFKTYAGIVRYTSSKDAQRIFITVTTGSALFALSNPLSFFLRNIYLVPFSIIIIDYITTVFALTTYRLIVKALYLELKNPTREKKSVIIYGAGEAGIITKRTLDRDAGTKYNVIAFIDDNPKKTGKTLEGIAIYSKEYLENLLHTNHVAHVILSIQSITPQKKKDVAEICLNYNTKLLNVPPVENWINGELSFKQIKKIKIEDLLEREPIQLDLQKIKQQLSDKIILVTGAAGSIGSEIVRQITPFNPRKIILFDNAESPLYDVDLELEERYKLKNHETIVGDIRNTERMENLFKTYHPQIVFHAAAYKHVPIMESNPSEALHTNVIGTGIIADLSVKYRVEKFVMISTDKAVNPTNVMGATKRIAEMYVQSLKTHSSTKFITTRFGNVLGSSGSVIPRFRKQIEEGLPITVTHPDITRYFMTIPEACQLVLEASVMGKGGEIFIFDMGESVKIVDLARKMVRLSGLTLGKDIQIVYTGLRPGEKLYEELLNNQEDTLPTHHPKIMIANVREYAFEKISKEIDTFTDLIGSTDNEAIVRKMKTIVPEFKSRNSVYEKLDL